MKITSKQRERSSEAEVKEKEAPDWDRPLWAAGEESPTRLQGAARVRPGKIPRLPRLGHGAPHPPPSTEQPSRPLPSHPEGRSPRPAPRRRSRRAASRLSRRPVRESPPRGTPHHPRPRGRLTGPRPHPATALGPARSRLGPEGGGNRLLTGAGAAAAGDRSLLPPSPPTLHHSIQYGGG